MFTSPYWDERLMVEDNEVPQVLAIGDSWFWFDDSGVIRILEHLRLWTPLPTERSPFIDPASWPPYASLPLTYHPVPGAA